MNLSDQKLPEEKSFASVDRKAAEPPVATLMNEGKAENDNPDTGETVKPRTKGWGTRARVVFVGKNTLYFKRFAFLLLTIGCISLASFFVGENCETRSKFHGVDALLTIQQELEQAQLEIQTEIQEQEDILKAAMQRIAFLKDQMIKFSIQKLDNCTTPEAPGFEFLDETILLSYIQEEMNQETESFFTTMKKRIVRECHGAYRVQETFEAEMAKLPKLLVQRAVKKLSSDIIELVDENEAAVNEAEHWKSIATKHLKSGTTSTRRLDLAMLVATVWLGAALLFLVPAIASDGQTKD